MNSDCSSRGGRAPTSPWPRRSERASCRPGTFLRLPLSDAPWVPVRSSSLETWNVRTFPCCRTRRRWSGRIIWLSSPLGGLSTDTVRLWRHHRWPFRPSARTSTLPAADPDQLGVGKGALHHHRLVAVFGDDAARLKLPGMFCRGWKVAERCGARFHQTHGILDGFGPGAGFANVFSGHERDNTTPAFVSGG